MNVFDARIAAIQKDARSLVYISDGSSGSDKVKRLLESIPWLIARITELEAERSAREAEDLARSEAGDTPWDDAVRKLFNSHSSIAIRRAIDAGEAIITERANDGVMS